MRSLSLLSLDFAVSAWSNSDCTQVEGMLPACVHFVAPSIVLKGDTITYKCMDLIHDERAEVRTCAAQAFVAIIVQTSETSEEAAEGTIDEFFNSYPCEFVALYNKNGREYKEQSAHLLAAIYYRDQDSRVQASMAKFHSAVKSCKETKTLETVIRTELESMVKAQGSE